MSRNRINRTRATAISAAVVLMLSLGGCSKFQSAEKFVADAKNYEQKGDHKAAVIQLKNALQKDPNSVEARILLGNVYVETGDGPSAENEFRKALELGANKDQLLPALAKSLQMQGQFQNVLDETKLIADAKPSAELFTTRGNAFLGLNQYPAAKDAFEQALKLQADYPNALIGLAKQAFASKDFDTANKYADQATSKNSSSIDAWLFKGDLLRIQGKPDGALAAYSETLKLQPDNPTALIEKANIEISMKKFAEAQADILAAKKINPDSLTALYSQAFLDFSQGKNKESLDSLQQLGKSAPKYLPGILLTGAVQYALGSTKQSEVYLKKYLEEVPKNVYAQKLLAASQLKNGHPDDALKTLEPSLQNTESKDSQLFALAGDAAAAAKNYTKANEYFDKAVELAPENSGYRTGLGISRLGMGDSDRAVADLEKASTLNEKSPVNKAGILLVMTHLRLKEYDKAMATIQGLEKEQPDNPILQNLKGDVYLSKNDLTSARASFEKAVALQPTYFPAISNLAKLDVHDKKFDAAKQRFTSLLDKDKKNLPALLSLAALAQIQNKNDDARQWLEKAVDAHPESVMAAQLVIANYLHTGEKQKALTSAKNFQTSHSDNPGFLNLLAQTQEVADDKQGAIDSFAKLAALYPESAAAQFRVGAAYLAVADDNSALDAFKKTLSIDPKFLNAQIAIASIEARRGNYDNALKIAKDVQGQDQKSAGGYVMEGDILMYQKKPALALKSYETAYKLDKRGAVLVKVHYALLEDGKAKDADARMLQYLKDNANDNGTRMYYALSLLKLQKSKLPAIEQFQILLKNEPDNVIVLNNLAWAYGEEKNPKALEYAEKAYQLGSNNPQVLDTYGWLLVQKGDVNRGLPMLQQAAKQQPEAYEVRYHLAYALAKSGAKDNARKELEQITGKNFPSIEDAKTLLKQVSA